MLLLAWFVGGVLAGPLDLDDAQICAARERVAMSPDVQRSFRPRGPCPGVVPAQTVADYFKAFAVLSRELAEVDNADRLVRTVNARWLLIQDGGGLHVYDAEAREFVPPAVFAAAAAPDAKPLTAEETAAEVAYGEAYNALRAKRYDEARTKLTECLAANADHVGCHWELGWVHWVAEDWAAAAASWTEVEQRQPDYPELGEWLPKARAKAGPAD